MDEFFDITQAFSVQLTFFNTYQGLTNTLPDNILMDISETLKEEYAEAKQFWSAS